MTRIYKDTTTPIDYIAAHDTLKVSEEIYPSQDIDEE